jgi:cob(I)alamin adenosyltransferase
VVKIYTKGGDKGQTGLFSGERVSKNHPLVNAYGTVDELNSVLGIARSQIAVYDDSELLEQDEQELQAELAGANLRSSEGRVRHAELTGALEELAAHKAALVGATALDEKLHTIQLELFELGAELASGSPGQGRITDAQIERFERWIDALTAGLPPLQNFILPTGHPVAAQLHQARTVSRRAERLVVAAQDERTADGQPRFDEVVIRYLNRLADLLFVLAREANRVYGVPDEEWHSPQSTESS